MFQPMKMVVLNICGSKEQNTVILPKSPINHCADTPNMQNVSDFCISNPNVCTSQDEKSSHATVSFSIELITTVSHFQLAIFLYLALPSQQRAEWTLSER
jgi:hypothetical protein